MGLALKFVDLNVLIRAALKESEVGERMREGFLQKAMLDLRFAKRKQVGEEEQLGALGRCEVCVGLGVKLKNRQRLAHGRLEGQ